jgi:Cu(I)/Ag(I) efflux system membrane fusion protein
MKDMDEQSHANHSEQQKIYTCPMHPEIIRNEPGKCPICGMDLVEKLSEGITSSEKSLEFLLKPTNTYVLSQVKTLTPKQSEFPIEINVTGKITYDTREISVVSARVAGRIEKLYIKYLYQPVEKGQKLMDIYSKELVTEQENYIYLLNSDAENSPLIKTAENRLLLQGVTNDQISKLKSTKQPFQSVTIYSPYTGHLHDLTGTSVSTDMQSMSNVKPSELTIKEGMYVQKGQSVFNIYSTKKVWAVLNIYSDKISQIKVGQKVKLMINNEITLDGNFKIDFIEPEIRAGQNTIAVRVYFSNNANKIKIGSNVNAIIEAENKNGLFIPSASLIHLGNSEVVFVKDNQLFRAHKVQTGVETNNFIEIISGLTEKDTLAENAQLLMDSESFIKSKNK